MKLKRFAAALLSALMVLGLSATALAASNPALPPDTGNLHIHKYLLASGTEPTDPGDPDGNPSPTLPEDATPLAGITFNLYKINTNSTSSGTPNGYLPGNGSYRFDGNTTLTYYPAGGGQSVTFTVAAANPASITTGDGEDGTTLGVATANNLAQGYYLVVEQADDRVANPADPFVVAVPMTNPADESSWITDVHVYPKNQGLDVSKTITSTTDSVSIGDTVEYTIKAYIPSGIYSDVGTEDANIEYVITDTLDESLTFNSTSLVVKGHADEADTNGTALTATTHYTLNSAPAFSVTFTDEGRKELYDRGYSYITITFNATVNENALDKETSTVGNQADLDFTNKFDQEVNGESDIVDIHYGNIQVIKQDAANQTRLNGAQFQIASSQENAEAGHYLKKTTDGKVVDYGEEGYDEAEDWIVTTANDGDADGMAIFEGLADYTGTGDGKTYLSYWIVETKAPDGYNLLADPVQVTFSAENSTSENAYTVEITVNNTQGFTLPETGGTGTILFTVGGIALVGVAVILLVTTRKRKAQ